MFFPPFNEEKSRYERKFLVTDMSYHGIELQLKLHPSSFSSLFYPRYINNIYLDTTELDFYADNVSGKGSRKKARIRWYGDMNGRIEKPVLEFKRREGMLGNKLSFPLSPFSIDGQLNQEVLRQSFRNSNLPEWAFEVMAQLKPSLLNRYKREYFQSFDGHFRLTLDDELQYFGMGVHNNNLLEKHIGEGIIVELKYDKQKEDMAANITNHLPFRLTKSSKYVNGLEALHPMLA